ncbi:helix-turn-helix domain-containing protein [Hymenobacter sp. RP-2-7]|uniref:Helix-turn-helix domain-containing protein n=1 Tax=Hymenobacter polaris TaxID=2682546 RepID=A0A7Y0AAW7_9BACT|nr:helix-turn-helix transcriptional regulator [Hymenobacter polaris]NML63999.1 helix-turn-helix domain-containing protein [Hymenobacter polaris]
MLTHGQIVRLIFGLKLRELRQERGLSPAELARRCEVSVSYLNEIEKGKKYPKADKILAFSKGLGVRYDQLTATTLPRRLEPIADLLQSQVLQEFPLELYGLEPARLFDMIATAPTKVMAFISTLIEIARNYELRQEQFLVAALRAYQEMHDNYFEDLEQAARAFGARHQLDPAAPPDPAALEAILTQEYGYTIDRTTLAAHPVAVARRLRSVFRPATNTLLLLPTLSRGQQNFVLGRELGFQYLRLTERHYASPNPLEVRSFEEALNNFQASYFASALLLAEEQLVPDLRALLAAPTWQPAALPALLARYAVSPELLMQRLTTLLPKHFHLSDVFFLRFDQATVAAPYKLTKQLHLGGRHRSHGRGLHEHYCRRWVGLRLLAEGRANAFSAGTTLVLPGAQRSQYLGTADEYLCLSLARVGAAHEPAMSVTVGLRCDDNLRQQVSFLADPALASVVVNETCERCLLPDCTVRAAPPTQAQHAAERATFEAAVEALVRGEGLGDA